MVVFKIEPTGAPSFHSQRHCVSPRQRGYLNMTRKRRLLVNAVIILLIILGFYFGVFHVPEAGGSVVSAAAAR
jgi:hypothetical protein